MPPQLSSSEFVRLSGTLVDVRLSGTLVDWSLLDLDMTVSSIFFHNNLETQVTRHSSLSPMVQFELTLQ